MKPLRPLLTGLAVILLVGCGATTASGPGETSKGGKANSDEGGSHASGGNQTTGGYAESTGGTGATGGTRGGSTGAGGETVSGGSHTGGATGGAHSGGSPNGGAYTGGTGNASSGGKASGGAGGANTGGSNGGVGGQSAGGSAGQRAVQCTGAMPYFPEFNRACVTEADCVAVAHQTNCCGGQLVSGIRASEQAAFDAAELVCDQQYPLCGCAAFGVEVEDGTRVDFAWKDQVEVACDAGTCKARYSGKSFACGPKRCTEQQYCIESSGGPAGTPTSYSCNPTACTDCSCLAMVGCTCTNTDGHLTFTCQRA